MSGGFRLAHRVGATTSAWTDAPASSARIAKKVKQLLEAKMMRHYTLSCWIQRWMTRLAYKPNRLNLV
jgi:hypothetical protein